MKLKVLAGITPNRAVKALFSLWSLKKRKLSFIEKVKMKDFKVRHIDSYIQIKILTLKHQNYKNCY